MIISDFTQAEIDWFLKKCNFTDLERDLFVKRAKGDTLDSIAEDLHISRDWAGKVSQKVNRKLIRAL